MRIGKLKAISSEQYINGKTGDVETFHVIRVEPSDHDFSKIWIGLILDAIQEVGNAKMIVLTFLLANRQLNSNMIVMTNQEIAYRTSVSVKTVQSTIAILIKHNIIYRKVKGVLILNPDVIFKGGHDSRMKVLIEYNSNKADSAQKNKVKLSHEQPIIA